MMVRSGVFSIAGTTFRASVQIVSNVVVARVLGPDAYGLAAAVLALGVVLELVRNSGFAAVVLRSGVHPADVHVALHRASAATGLLLGGLVAVAGLLVRGALPSSPSGGLLLAVAVAFPLAGFVAVPIAAMVRDHEMGRVALVESIAVVLGSVLAIGLALAGAGPVAMVSQVVAVWVVITVGVVVLRRVPRGVAASWRSVRTMAALARDVSLVQVVSLVARAGDRVLVAVLFGPAASGLYVQAMQLMTLPLDQIGAAVQRIAIPAMVGVDAVVLRNRFRRLVGTVTLLAWPVLAVLGVLADPIVHLLFGVEWLGSAALLPFLVVAGGAQALGFAAVWYFIASGRSGRQVRWALVTQPAVVGALVLGTVWGPTGMAAAYAIACTCLVVPAFLVATRGSGLRMRDLGLPVLPAAAATSAAVLVSAAVRGIVGADPIGSVLLPGLLGALAALLVALVFPDVRSALPRRRRRPPRSRPRKALARGPVP
ncbi:oligosaccharide flippase family protein [Curtobacterium flaccumfaciens pv. flaccumfaciens]|nr:oligosaccharide flippase family protein [Curtobacterium flaccumfaciens pv. flaccumfaciens]